MNVIENAAARHLDLKPKPNICILFRTLSFMRGRRENGKKCEKGNMDSFEIRWIRMKLERPSLSGTGEREPIDCLIAMRVTFANVRSIRLRSIRLTFMNNSTAFRSNLYRVFFTIFKIISRSLDIRVQTKPFSIASRVTGVFKKVLKKICFILIINQNGGRKIR